MTMLILRRKNFSPNARPDSATRVRNAHSAQKIFGTRRPSMPMPSASKPSHAALGLEWDGWNGWDGLVDLAHEALARLLGPLVVVVHLARRDFDLDRLHVLIREPVEQMTDAVEARALLLVGVDHVPRRPVAVG